MVGGKESIPAIGFAVGVERLLMLTRAGEGGGPAAEVFLVTSNPRFLEEAFRWKMDLIGRGVRAEMDYEGRSVKAQFRRAGRSAEDARGAVVFRDMAAGSQEEVSRDEARSRLIRRTKED
jgi:histidyl-tRNA synthetase